MKIGTLLGAVAGGILMFLLGFLAFGVLLSEFFKANTFQYPGLMKDPPNVPLIFLFNLVWAWLIAWVLEFAGRSGWAQGAKAGAIIMFFVALGGDLDFEAFLNMHKSFTPLLVHILIATVMGAIAGAVIGLIQARFGGTREL